MCAKIKEIKSPTIELWQSFRRKDPKSILDKAFSLLFFNRTNYSGIFGANPLGGLSQKSKWKIDCRWNSTLLCERIVKCSQILKGTKITCLDFEELILTPGEDVFLFLDPPYYEKGSKLYPVSMSHDEHVKLANLLKRTNHKFLLTIDDCPITREIYFKNDFYINTESWLYTINSSKTNKKGREMFISNFRYPLDKKGVNK